MKINSIHTSTALASFFIAFAIMLIGVVVVIPPAGTIIIQEAQAQQQEQQTREEAPTEATENMPDGPSKTLAADDPTQKEGDDVAPNADKELDTVTVCIDVPPSQMTEEVTVGEAQFLEETIPESELSYGAC
jgi:flagellar biosynthesis/type III secretory pathway M-ring protein FliF/YscJ